MSHWLKKQLKTIKRKRGRKPKLALKQNVLLPLIKQLVGKNNRSMVYLLDLSSLLTGVDIGYKVIEMLYSDEEVAMTLHNLHVLLLKKRGLKEINSPGDSTGYSLLIGKHYSTIIGKKKEKAKKNPKVEGRIQNLPFLLRRGKRVG